MAISGDLLFIEGLEPEGGMMSLRSLGFQHDANIEFNVGGDGLAVNVLGHLIMTRAIGLFRGNGHVFGVARLHSFHGIFKAGNHATIAEIAGLPLSEVRELRALVFAEPGSEGSKREVRGE